MPLLTIEKNTIHRTFATDEDGCQNQDLFHRDFHRGQNLVEEQVTMNTSKSRKQHTFNNLKDYPQHNRIIIIMLLELHFENHQRFFNSMCNAAALNS